MSVKILLADDSPTVHKVIKIILKDEPCEVIECAREAELAAKLKDHQPSVVFLDFNFSETKTGYELCRFIKEQVPHTKVLVMYGTFDSIDESALTDSGADQHVVKPFDTSKFIIQVRNLADGMTHPQEARESTATPKRSPQLRESVERQAPDVGVMTHETVVEMKEDLDQWGMLVPGVIGKSAGAPDLPPVIEETPVKSFSLPEGIPHTVKAPANDYVLPDQSDLEYPDMTSTTELSLELETPKSKLVSLNELAPLDESKSLPRLLELSGMDDVEGDERLAALIQDETEADLWSVDGFEDRPPKLAVVTEKVPVFEEPHFVARDEEFQPFEFEDPLPPEQKSPGRAPALGDIDQLKPLIEELVKKAVAEYCREQAEKVSWEVIPDLAENLIKQELRKISDKISRDL